MPLREKWFFVEKTSLTYQSSRISNGIGYTFQITSIFVNLTVYENVALAIRKDNSNGEENSVSEVLSKVGLLDRIEQRSGDLSYGHQRLLELAMGMAQKPKLLILDEPTQGLSDSEIENFKKLIKDISSSTTILLIEHNMDVVMSIADNISVLHFGEIIADGDKETIQNDPIVQKLIWGLMLKVENLTSYYSNIKILKNLSFNLEKGKVLCLLGRNGAGKTTTLKSLMGLVDKTEGKIIFNGEKISGISAHLIPQKGIGYVPQGRRLFSELTVEENLEIGLLTRKKGENTKNNVLTMFPRLRERLDQISGTLSGGEQQMLALARALCIEPSLLLLDEPTEGLQPSMISLIRKSILELKKQGVAILLVEQRVEAILSIADEILVIENGSIVYSAKANEVVKDHKKLYIVF